MKPLSRRCNWRRTNGHSKQSESEAAGGVERKSSTSQGGAKGSSREIGNCGELVPMSLELTRSSKRNTKRFNVSLYCRDKSYFLPKKRKKAFFEVYCFEHRVIREGWTPVAQVFHNTSPSASVLELSHPSLRKLDSRSVRRLTIRFVSCDRSSAASCIGGSVASLLLSLL